VVLATLVTHRRPLLSTCFVAVLLIDCAGRSGTALNTGAAGSISAGGGKTAAAIRNRSTDRTAAGSSRGTDGAVAPIGLRPNIAPGGNFDLSHWELQEPVGLPKTPTTIGPAVLAGPNGYQDDYFFTDKTDGAMTFWAPENGVTTANSRYPRSELRELNADGTKANWPITGIHTLSATLAVTRVPDHVCVGQIHCGAPLQSGLTTTTKPLLELYYYRNGDIKLGIENGPVGGQTSHYITNVRLGAKFSYEIQLAGNGNIELSLDGKTHAFTMPSSLVGYGEYFKAGNYDQSAGGDSTVGAIVKFYALRVVHQP